MDEEDPLRCASNDWSASSFVLFCADQSLKWLSTAYFSAPFSASSGPRLQRSQECQTAFVPADPPRTRLLPEKTHSDDQSEESPGRIFRVKRLYLFGPLRDFGGEFFI